MFSLTSGTVILKEEGGGGLSTLSIYNATLDATVIYLHTNPLDGLNVGEHVERGQRIATEAARGTSSAHTHVEMRPGRRERAAVSVNDSTLDNPIPTTFWMNPTRQPSPLTIGGDDPPLTLTSAEISQLQPRSCMIQSGCVQDVMKS